MGIILGILCVVILILLVILWKQQRQMKEICRQLSFLNEHDSNMMITVDMRIGWMGKLTDNLNEFLKRRRRERKEYLDKEKLISDTYTNLSHDIRTPLTSLDGYFQLLERSRTKEDQERYLAVIHERISSLKEMLEELFTFTKLKNGGYQITLSPCSLNRIVKNTIFAYFEDWSGQGIEPELQITEEVLMVNGNQQALCRVIQNIIKNGMDHGEKKIMVLLQRRRDCACLRIGNLVTAPEEIDVDRVFERFYKADVSRTKNSTGLGLAIAREFVLRMDGTIAASLEGEEFWIEITLPLCSSAGIE